jgi:hypothetical protein
MSHNRHPYSSPDNFGGGVHHTRSQKATIRAFDKFYSWFPSFLDMFPDEEAFVNFAFWFVVLTIECVTWVILSGEGGEGQARQIFLPRMSNVDKLKMKILVKTTEQAGE